MTLKFILILLFYMMKSKFLPQWDKLYSFVVVVVVEQNKKTFSLKRCCESVLSTIKQVKSKHCSIHTFERVCAAGVISKRTVTNFRLHADVCTKVCADPGRLSWAWPNDDFYVMLTKGDSCGHVDIESRKWPLDFGTAFALLVIISFD